MKILLATEKSFSKDAVLQITNLITKAGAEIQLLENYTDINALLAAVVDVDALIVRSDKVTQQVIDAAPKLKIVVRAGAGYDNLDLVACSARQIVAMNTPGQNSNAVAELVLGLMVFAARNNFGAGTGSELKGKRLGIQAYGNVGKLVAQLGMNLGMTVATFDPYVDPSKVEKGVQVVAHLDDLYRNSDYLSLHIPATAQTIGAINQQLLSLLPKGACVINTARKEIMNEADLLQIMQTRTDLKYLSDVRPDKHAELLQFAPRYFSTAKKIGAETQEANVNAGLAAAAQILNFFATGNETFRVNK